MEGMEEMIDLLIFLGESQDELLEHYPQMVRELKQHGSLENITV